MEVIYIGSMMNRYQTKNNFSDVLMNGNDKQVCKYQEEGNTVILGDGRIIYYKYLHNKELEEIVMRMIVSSSDVLLNNRLMDIYDCSYYVQTLYNTTFKKYNEEIDDLDNTQMVMIRSVIKIYGTLISEVMDKKQEEILQNEKKLKLDEIYNWYITMFDKIKMEYNDNIGVLNRQNELLLTSLYDIQREIEDKYYDSLLLSEKKDNDVEIICDSDSDESVEMNNEFL